MISINPMLITKAMKTRTILVALLLMVAGTQAAVAQGFRVYKTDGTFTQYSIRTDSIVFYDGIGEEVDFGPFSPVNQLICGVWYDKTDTIAFNEDGTTDFMEGATYKFLPYQGSIIIYNSGGAPANILKVHDVADDKMVVSALGSDSFSVWTRTKSDSEPQLDGHAYVEIGGLKWATMNVGATTVAGDYATCCGDYFAWGETEPRYVSMTHNGTKATIIWKESYPYGHTSDYTPTYTGTKLDAAHDVATVKWGENWRTPTEADYKALAKACTNSESNDQIPLTDPITKGGIYWLSDTQTIDPTYAGVAGVLFVSASDISKRVFFPANGFVHSTTLHYCGKDGDYWSSSIDTAATGYAWAWDFDKDNVDPSYHYLRHFGFAVRPVSD